MKILFVSALLPYPLFSGGQIRMYNLLKRLGKKHEIHLYSFIRSEKEKEYLPKLAFCKKVVTVHRGHVWQPKYLLKTLTSSYPLLWSSYHSSEMLSILSDEVAHGRYDLIHIEPGYVWPSIPTVHRIPIVITEHNIEHEVYGAYARQIRVYPLRPFLSLDVAKMIRWEKRSWGAAAGIVTVSSEDKQTISESADTQKISVVPNGVDTKLFAFRPKKTLSKENLIFVYVGNFLWMENRDAVKELIQHYWPVIHEKYPTAKLRIVGRHAPENLKKFSGKHIRFLSTVDIIQDELRRADILLAPIRIGGGTKYKILESMASGLPVITTSIGAQGISVQKKELWIAENPHEVLKAVEDILGGADRSGVLERARKHVEEEYSWDQIAQTLDGVWRKTYETASH